MRSTQLTQKIIRGLSERLTIASSKTLANVRNGDNRDINPHKITPIFPNHRPFKVINPHLSDPAL